MKKGQENGKKKNDNLSLLVSLNLHLATLPIQKIQIA